MRFFRTTLVLLAFILAGSQVQTARASLNRQTGTTPLYLPIVMNQSPTVQQPRTGWIGPDGGSVLGLVVDPQNQNIVYAGTFGAGMFKSTDAGQTWFPINSGLDNPKVQSLAIDPNYANILYAGMYRDETGNQNEGIYKTVDGGQSWFKTSAGIQVSAIVYSIAIDPSNTNRIYISTRGRSTAGHEPWNGKIYRSDNGGASWAELAGMSNVGGAGQQDWAYSIAVYPDYPNQVYAATHQHGPYLSTDYGNNWQASNSGINPSNLNGRSIAVQSDSGTQPTLYFGVWKYQPGVYRSLDRNSSWAQVNSGLAGNSVYGITINPRDPSNVFLATFHGGLYRSTNYGNSWSQAGLPLLSTWIVAFSPRNSSEVYAGSYGGGVYKSSDGGSSWAIAGTGIRDAWVTGIVTNPSSPREQFVSLYGGGIKHTIDGGQTWEDFNSGLPDLYINALSIHPDGTSLLALTDSQGLYRVSISGGGWSTAARAMPKTLDADPLYPSTHPLADQIAEETALQDSGDSKAATIMAAPTTLPLVDLKFAASNQKVIYLATAGSGVYRSSDGGSNWYADGLAGETVYNLEVSPSNENLVYAATSISGTIRFSTNGGGSWGDLFLPGRTVYTLLIPDSQPEMLYAGTDSGIYAWNGSSWSLKGMSGLKVSTLSTHSEFPGLIIAGTTNGAYFSKDLGTSWTSGPSDLAGLTIQTIDIEPSSGLVYYGTTTRGIFEDLIP